MNTSVHTRIAKSSDGIISDINVNLPRTADKMKFLKSVMTVDKRVYRLKFSPEGFLKTWLFEFFSLVIQFLQQLACKEPLFCLNL